MAFVGYGSLDDFGNNNISIPHNSRLFGSYGRVKTTDLTNVFESNMIDEKETVK